MADRVSIRRALISVSDKTDVVAFASRLARHGVELISTGGTARALDEAGLTVTPIESITEFPEMMGGRVKTLHPRIHGALLGLRDDPDHTAAMEAHGIVPIDLVCVNLYPFEETVRDRDAELAEAIEQIDIGGPSMIRSAAKNFRHVAVVTSPGQYDEVTNELDAESGATTGELRQRLASTAFARTAAYDTAIARFLDERTGNTSGGPADLPETLLLRMDRAQSLRYGENPHQRGVLYADPRGREPSVARAEQLHGKALSFNNLYDADGALGLVKEIGPEEAPAAAVIKHANPCGFAVGDDLATAFERAYDGDPLAAFGGIVALNRVLDEATANRIAEGEKFLEVIVAPDYEERALEILRDRFTTTRLLRVGHLAGPDHRDRGELEHKRLVGGLLVQDRDLAAQKPASWQHAAGPDPDDTLLAAMSRAMIAVKHLKSNAIALWRDDRLVGGGPGQVDRVTSCRIAVQKAGGRARGAVAASDAFFPFRDGPDALIEAGVSAIAQPGGSKRDQDTIDACAEAGVTLVLTHQRHFRH